MLQDLQSIGGPTHCWLVWLQVKFWLRHQSHLLQPCYTCRCRALPLLVCSDVNYLSASSTPPAAAEWQSLLRPLRGREPEGMWNLLSIVREMFRRHDNNSVLLLEILTGEVLQCEQVSVQCSRYLHQIVFGVPCLILGIQLSADLSRSYYYFLDWKVDNKIDWLWHGSGLLGLLFKGFTYLNKSKIFEIITC